jgi:branched-chain amino acid transport system ATP-binding protein
MMLLDVQMIHTFYDMSHILFGVSLQVQAGECVCLLGRNGAGKTTTFNSIMGLVAIRNGQILFDGQAIHGKPAHTIAKMGLGLVPETREIFPTLTVWENLDIARKPNIDGKFEWTLARIYDLFPRLAERRNQMGATLSGGEQQMLTIARTLMGNPHLLLLDEPSEGLAPLIVAQIHDLIAQIKREGMTILLAEQNLNMALSLADRAYVMDDGRIQHHASTQELHENPQAIQQYMRLHR